MISLFLYRITKIGRNGLNNIVLPYYAPVFCYDYCSRNTFCDKFEETDSAPDKEGLLVTYVNESEDESRLQKGDRIIEFDGCALNKNGFLENGGL